MGKSEALGGVYITVLEEGRDKRKNPSKKNARWEIWHFKNIKMNAKNKIL